MGISVVKLLVILVIVFVIFGAGKLPKMMGDIGKGIKSFKDGLKGEEEIGTAEDTKLPSEKIKEKDEA